MDPRIKHYIPAVFLFLLALFFVFVPALAVFVVVGGLLFFGVIYSMIIYRIHKAQDQVKWSEDVEVEDPLANEIKNPNFKNVTVYLARRGNVDRFFE